MNRRRCLLPMVLALSACAGLTPPAPQRPPMNADQRAAAPSALAAERRWLQSWFEGTPVRIEQEPGGPVAIDVPLRYCFDEGSSRIKPPLAAVLDKLAESLRRVPAARLALLAAPGGPGGLALQRADRIRRHLLSRGVAAEQIAPPSASDAPMVRLRVDLAPA